MAGSCCIPKPLPCCEPIKAATPVAKAKSLPLSKKLERIAAIALSSFALYCNWSLFAASTAVGAIYQVVKIASKVNQEGQGTQRPGCGQGFGELISQLKLLSPEVVLATSYVAWRHLMHDPQGFVPFVGFFIGMGMVHHAHAYISKR